MTPITSMPSAKLLSLLPHASGVLREHIETVLRARYSGTKIQPMPCIKITTDTARALTYTRGNYSGKLAAEEGVVA
jgi:hypothetical protein